MLNLQAAYDAYADNHTESTKAQLWTEIYQFFHNRLTDEDLASDSCLQALNGITSYDPTRGPLNKWLANIAANLRHDHERRNRDTPVEEYELEQLQHVAAPVRMNLDLAAICDSQTRMLCEHILAGHSIGEAAQRCGLTPAAAYKRLNRLGRNIPRASLIF